MAILTVSPITLAAAVPIDSTALAAAAGGGDSFPNNGVQFLAVRNAGGAPINVTFVGQKPCSLGVAGTTAHDTVVAITNDSKVYMLGPFRTDRYNDANGRVQVSYSGVTSLTVAAFALPPSA
jgi:hypothetical protein